MEKIFLGLGSNLGQRKENIKKAIKLLAQNINNIKVASFFVSKPVGITDQPHFVNTALIGFTDLSVTDLLKFVKSVEKAVGRKERYRWGPREIDIDILFYGNLVLETENLIVPHPRLHERDFVLKPLLELEPEFVHPVFNKTLRELYMDLKEFSIIGEN